MRFPTNLVVLALATSTISPALSAPIRHNHARAHAEFEKRGGRLQLAETLFRSAKNMSPKSAKSFAPKIKSLFGSDVKEKSLSTLKWGGGMGLVGAGAQDISSHNKQAPHQRRALEPRAARAFAMEKRAGGAAGAGAKLVGSLLKNNKSWKQVAGQNALLGGLLSLSTLAANEVNNVGKKGYNHYKKPTKRSFETQAVEMAAKGGGKGIRGAFSSLRALMNREKTVGGHKISGKSFLKTVTGVGITTEVSNVIPDGSKKPKKGTQGS